MFSWLLYDMYVYRTVCVGVINILKFSTLSWIGTEMGDHI